MKKNILVTGATGFIGNYVIKQLLINNEFGIIATSRNKEHALKQDWFNNVKYVEYDLNDKKDNLFDYFNKPDLLIHLAWEGLPNYDSEIHIEKNLINHYTFIKSLINDGLKEINCIGTCFEYGLQNGCLSEDLSTIPNTTYGLAKDSLRKFLEDLNKKKIFEYKWIRLFYMYGKGQASNSLLSLVEQSIKNNDAQFNMSQGEQLRDYLPIEDIAKYIIMISLQNKINGIINCASGKPISIRSLVESYLKEKKSHIELNLGYYDYAKYEPIAFWANIKKLNTIKNNEC